MYSIFTLPHDFLHKKYTKDQTNHWDSLIHNAINAGDDTVSEDLTDDQKKKVDNWHGPSREARDTHDAAFGKGVERVVLPYDSSKDTPINSDNFGGGNGWGTQIHHTVIKALNATGHRTDDYGSGLAYHPDTPERKVKIAKVFVDAGIADRPTEHMTKPKYKAGEDGGYLRDSQNRPIVDQPPRNMTLSQAFAADPMRAAAKSEKNIVITRNRYDVAGMSTGRGWRSCMNMVDGINKHYLPKDIEHGTTTAYLTRKGDDGIHSPIARINLKKFTSGANGGHTIYRPESGSYGANPQGFHKAVADWAEKSYPSKPGIYSKHASLYNDDGNGIRMEKLDQLGVLRRDEVRNMASGTARDIIDAHTSLIDDLHNKGQWNDAEEEEESGKNNAYDAAHKIMDNLNNTEKFHHVAHYLIDHAEDHDGDSDKNDAFNIKGIGDLTGRDVMHQWAKNHSEKNHAISDGIRNVEPDELHAISDKIHKTISTTNYPDNHEELKRLHAHVIDHIFKRGTDAMKIQHLHGILDDTDSGGRDYYKDLHDNYSNAFGQNHPVQSLKDPRAIHSVLSHENFGDVFDHKVDDDVLEHIGHHADAKLADYAFHEYGMKHEHDSFNGGWKTRRNSDGVESLMKGLNANPNGEKIQHQLTDPILLTGGHADHEGMDQFKVNTVIDAKRYASGETHTIGYGRSAYNHETTPNHESQDYEHKYADIAEHTIYPSVHSKLMTRPDTQTETILGGGQENKLHESTIIKSLVDFITENKDGRF